MKTTYNVPDMLDEMIKEYVASHGTFPEILYLREDEFDFFQEWAEAHNLSIVYYYHYSLPHRVMIEWDGQILN